MKYKNQYSKHRLDNTFDVKFRANGSQVTNIFGTELRSSIDQNTIARQIDSEIAQSALGTTWVVDYVYNVERISNVDTNLTPKTYKGPKLFKLFKL